MKTRFSFIFLTLLFTSIESSYFDKFQNFIKKHRKTSEVCLATGANAAITATINSFYPSLLNVSFSNATLLGTVAARNFKNHKRRYLVNGGISFGLFILGGISETVGNSSIGDSIAAQFLVTNFLLLTNDLRKLSGRDKGESLFDNLMATEEDQPQTQETQQNDIEMQVLETYTPLADDSPCDSLNTSSASENSDSDNSQNEDQQIPSSESV